MTELTHTRFLKLTLLITASVILAMLLTMPSRALFPAFKPITLMALIFGIILLLALLVWYLQPERTSTPKKDVVDIVIKLLSSILLVASLAIAWFGLLNTQAETKRNLELSKTALENSRAEQRSQRLVSALEKLGGNTIHQKLAGIHGFEKLDSDFKSIEDYERWKNSQGRLTSEELAELEQKRRAEIREHWQIVDVLTSFLRTEAPFDNSRHAPPATPRRDFAMLLRNLGERNLTYENGEPEPLNLSGTDLRGYELNSTLSPDCNDPNARKVNFEGVRFGKANLEKIQLRCAKLRKAVFFEANLKSADFRNADLTGADFTSAHLENADLRNANLTDAEFGGAYLENADLTGAKIDQSGLEFAFVGPKTLCPSGFKPEPQCDKTCKCVNQ